MKHLRTLSSLALALTALTAGCDDLPPGPDLHPEGAAEARMAARGQANIVEVTAVHAGRQHRFELSTDEIPAGWTTLRFANQAHVVHFAYLSKVPEGITVEDYSKVARVFQNYMDSFSNKPLSFPELGFALPEWFPEVQAVGGSGFTAAGLTSETTLKLQPGNYILECYVKTPGGTFHHVLGMLAQLTVTERPSGAPEPGSTLKMTLLDSESGGIQVPHEVRPGKHTVAIHFGEQMTHGNLAKTDVQLVRLDEGTSLDAVAAWMNWTTPDGLTSPAPATFLGGTQEMPEGSTAYFTVNLTPGRYAWIAEVDNPDQKSMLKTFTVPFGQKTGR